MSILFDVFAELFKMFVADLRLTLAILAGVAIVAALLAAGEIGGVTGGLLLIALCIGVLIESVLREASRRKPD